MLPISDSGLEVAAGLEGDTLGVDLLMRSGWTWRTMVSTVRGQSNGESSVAYGIHGSSGKAAVDYDGGGMRVVCGECG